MPTSARKLVLPEYLVTEVAGPTDDPTVQRIQLPDDTFYWIRPRHDLHAASWGCSTKDAGGSPSLYRYPIVLQGNGEPWDEANLFLFELLGKSYRRNMATVLSIADDLVAYRRFLEEEDIDWKIFPSHRFSKPTYRFCGYLAKQVSLDVLKVSTANRRIGVIVRFYRWLQNEGLFTPPAPPWKEEVRYIKTQGANGQQGSVRIVATDLRIRSPAQDDSLDGKVQDGGKLRPLEPEEQQWLLEALDDCGNTEMTLIHLFALLTGARIQTILTFRVRHALQTRTEGEFLVYPVGPGTGIDTKHDKKLTLFIPTWFHRELVIYGSSDRARRRRRQSVGGDSENQYLFLSVRGAPFYVAKQDQLYLRAHPVRHHKCGQAIRQYSTDYILPYIRKKYDDHFHYRFHDLRATYGMNMVDHMQLLIHTGQMSYLDVLRLVQARMGHTSVITTEQYLKFRSRQKVFRKAQDGWEDKLKDLTNRTMEGLNA